MNAFQVISVGLDIVLVGLGIATYLRRPKLGGRLYHGMQILLIGLMIFGFVHLIESAILVFLILDEGWNELIHRLLVLAAFGLVLWGFSRMQRALDE